MIAAVLLDSRPDFLDLHDGAAPLLLTPAGNGTFLDLAVQQLGALSVRVAAVVAPGRVSDAYRAAIGVHAPGAAVLGPGGVVEMVHGLEPADRLLFLDARYVPMPRMTIGKLLAEPHVGGAAIHLVQLVRSPEGTRERVTFDSRRQVRAIERLYDGFTQTEAAGICASLLSVAQLVELKPPEVSGLRQLRTQLAVQGLLGRDLPASPPLAYVGDAAGLLAFSARLLCEGPGRAKRRGARTHGRAPAEQPAGAVDPCSEVRGVVVLQAGASIGPGATVIGPTVLGAGARIEEGAFVAQCVLGSQAVVGAGAEIVGRVVPGHLTVSAVEADGARRSNGVPLVEELGAETRHDWRAVCYAWAKRAFDFQAALFGMLMLSPLLLLIAGLIKLTSSGPVLFAHEREGLGGRVFRCWKFRTMKHRGHEQQRELYQQNLVDGPQFKLKRDPRVTWFGRWLRETNLDELPQLLNVLRGDMSLIGPRPSPFRENQICVPWRKARLSVRPGITGLWQVCRHDRLAGDFYQWILFDVLYVRHVSFWLDGWIFLATLVTLGGKWSVPLTWIIPARKLKRDLLGELGEVPVVTA